MPPNAADVNTVTVKRYHEGHSVCLPRPMKVTIKGDNKHTKNTTTANVTKRLEPKSL
jgi:hypothetical protein